MNNDEKKRLDLIVSSLSNLKFVSAVFIFGSRVSGKARADSDIDIAVLIKNPTREKELKVIGLGGDLFDISPISALPLNIQFRVIRDGKSLFLRDEAHLRDFKVSLFREYLDFSSFMNSFYRRAIKNV